MNKKNVITLTVLVVLLIGFLMYRGLIQLRRQSIYLKACKDNGQSAEFCSCTWQGITNNMTKDEINSPSGLSQERINNLVTVAGWQCIKFIKI